MRRRLAGAVHRPLGPREIEPGTELVEHMLELSALRTGRGQGLVSLLLVAGKGIQAVSQAVLGGACPLDPVLAH